MNEQRIIKNPRIKICGSGEREGRKEEPEGSKTPQEHDPQNQLTDIQVGSKRPCMGLT